MTDLNQSMSSAASASSTPVNAKDAQVDITNERRAVIEDISLSSSFAREEGKANYFSNDVFKTFVSTRLYELDFQLLDEFILQKECEKLPRDSSEDSSKILLEEEEKKVNPKKEKKVNFSKVLRIEEGFNPVYFSKMWSMFPNEKRNNSFTIDQCVVGKARLLRRLIYSDCSRFMVNNNWNDFNDKELVLIIGVSISDPQDQAKGYSKLEKACILMKDTIRKMKKYYNIETVFLLSANYLEESSKKEFLETTHKLSVLNRQKLIVHYYNNCSFGSVISISQKLSEKYKEVEYLKEVSEMLKQLMIGKQNMEKELNEKFNFDNKGSIIKYDK